MVNRDAIRTQYHDDRNLNARIALHARFSTNTYGWSRWIFDRVTLPARAQVLELGCGPGSLWTDNRGRLSPTWHVTLTDFSMGMVRAARGNLASAESRFSFAAADAQQGPFPTAGFDAVMAHHMLYHVPNRPQALREIRRVLKPEGTFYATTVGEEHMNELWALLVPYVPDIYTRVTAVSRTFTLENGGAQLAEVFDHVERHIYEDDLEVTEVEPLIAYLKSSPTPVVRGLTCDQLDAVRRQVADRISTRGSFHIHKASGIFVTGAG